MGDKDLPLLSNIKDIRARHYLLHLKTSVVSQIIEGIVFIFLEPATLCEKNGNCCVRECFCSDKRKVVSEAALNLHGKEIFDDSNSNTTFARTSSGLNEADKASTTKSFYEGSNNTERNQYEKSTLADSGSSGILCGQSNLEKACALTSQSACGVENVQEGQNILGQAEKIDSEDLLVNHILHEVATQSEAQNDFKVVLDCCDIKVKSVSEVICDKTEVSQYLHPAFIRKCSFALNIWSGKEQVPLQYTVEPWSINIWKRNVQKVADFPRVICIKYETSPQGQSLLWRNDQDGNPCVFTPAATINNRSLLPCQDPPSAMATWQAWFTVPKGYYLSMTGDERPVKFIGCIEDYKDCWLMNHSDFKNCDTQEPCQGSTISRQDMAKEIIPSVCFYYHTTMVLPIATIAIAIGKWAVDILPVVKPENKSCGSSVNNKKAKETHPCKHYEYPCHIQSKYWASETALSVVYPPSSSEAIKSVASFLPFALQASCDLLGRYPCPRLEVVLVPKCFASLGLASPNLIFLSPSMVLDDPAAYIRLAHEISHAWFGINIGAQDWTEEWISEGFATYMEDSIYALATLIEDSVYKTKQHSIPETTSKDNPIEIWQDQGVNGNVPSETLKKDGFCDGSDVSCDAVKDKVVTCSSVTLLSSLEHKAMKMKYLEELSDLRAHIRYRTLTSELENSSVDLQKLRPMQGEALVDDSGIGYVKDGRNPEKTFLQVHYLKGYFLLKYMSRIIGRKTFDSMIKDYVTFYHGQLVLSEQIIDFFISAYPEAAEKGMTRSGLYEEWLNHPGLNPYITEKYGNISNQLVSAVKSHFNYWVHVDKSSRQKPRVKKMKINLEKFSFPDQIVLLLEYILELKSFSCKALLQIYEHYDIVAQNADVRHRWCELVILNNFPDLHDVRRFLTEDQAMGVYLYGELVISGKKKHRKLAEEVYGEIKEDMDENARVTVSLMLFGE
ncbi:aminopeptidase O-like [Penaeus chinensis]|uniref:aminopeptidase O-like n=1 Tax=Penaeus chinensis TaxID=139456 RepID=UPI001FB7BBC8|nr:aminopeptidase O-like [Penaeus chinensis]XP_047495132.1 aminopeptidase O-like [Penaeus chinensis]